MSIDILAPVHYTNSVGFIKLDQFLDKIVYANEKACALFGVDDMIGRSMSEFIAPGQMHPHPTKDEPVKPYHHKHDVSRTQGVVKGLHADGSEIDVFVMARIRYKLASGEIMWGALVTEPENVGD